MPKGLRCHRCPCGSHPGCALLLGRASASHRGVGSGTVEQWGCRRGEGCSLVVSRSLWRCRRDASGRPTPTGLS